ncbi:MAG: hypothetical protein K9M54_06465 [Kiritimatiellales bacterium]|nr:hypothetical protein [Kiritimatiellales bacterium]MCF7864763.1 hypothetical protein [Kiritimatiellales bacterium]
MKKQYMFGMFALCFCIWAVVVDQMVLPGENQLRQDVGAYSRYRVKHWSKNGKLDLLQDQLLVYVVVKNREQLYYMDSKPYFESSLKSLAKGTPVQVRYDVRFPKVWKKCVYEVRANGVPVVRYSAAQLFQKQREIWKFTEIMGGVFLLLAILGLINKPRPR